MPSTLTRRRKPVTRVEHVSGPREICVHCGQLIVRVPEVGWFDPHLGTSYDICPADRYGNHLPESDPEVQRLRALITPRRHEDDEA